MEETVWLGNLPVATVRDHRLYYIHTDHLGTPRVITEPGSGRVVWQWRSGPFGTGQPNEDPSGTGRKFVYNLRFAGQYYDSESGTTYNGFRDYDPGLGRYLESDPTGLYGGLNSYSYVLDNPVLLSDPFGFDGINLTSFSQDEAIYLSYTDKMRSLNSTFNKEAAPAELDALAAGSGFASFEFPPAAAFSFGLAELANYMKYKNTGKFSMAGAAVPFAPLAGPAAVSMCTASSEAVEATELGLNSLDTANSMYGAYSELPRAPLSNPVH